jgi:hypothetical protein
VRPLLNHSTIGDEGTPFQDARRDHGSFEKDAEGANPHSGAYDNDPSHAAKDAAGLEAVSVFYAAYRCSSDNFRRNGRLQLDWNF